MINSRITLGSLFSGSGGFELAGRLNGVDPVWDSEIEPFPMRVTAKRFPNCKQLGDVTNINGKEIEPVDIITFGSPCQNLSIAGAREGLIKGDRSSLFFEATRIIKEMRESERAIGRSDVDIRPRFAVFENVTGLLSSHKGEDFRIALTEFCKVKDRNAVVPRPPKGKWLPVGCIVGDGYSIAWRTYDSQYWPGTPQRRKRIYLIADYASECAGKILFEQESVCRDSAQIGAEREGTSGNAKGSASGSGERSVALYESHPMDSRIRECFDGISPTVTVKWAKGTADTPLLVYPVENHPNDSRVKLSDDGMVQTLTTRMGTGGGNVPIVLEVKDEGIVGR